MIMNRFIEYFKDPELVVRVQEFFGIEYVIRNHSDPLASDYDNSNGHDKEEGQTLTLRKNGKIDKNHLNSNGYNRTANGRENGVKNEFGGASAKNGLESSNLPSSSLVSCSIRPSVTDNTKSAGQHRSCSTSPDYIVHNKFWYYLFIFGTELGDEIFYAIFIPFYLWNVDSAVGRRMVFLWSLVMYFGQSCKDIIRWPRPGPPVIRLQKKWGLEYGMPSTHAMVGLSIPFSVYIFTQQRYNLSPVIGISLASLWCLIVCLSRIYLGMHSVLDVIAGLGFTGLLMLILMPMVDYLDFYIISKAYSPLIVLFISIMLIVYYPVADKWTPTRGDTTMTVSVCAGLQIATWLNYQEGILRPPTDASLPYDIVWPTNQMWCLLILRTVLGMTGLVATRAIAKSLSYGFVSALLGKDPNEIRNSENHLHNKNKTIVDLSYKFFTYGMFGFNAAYLLPKAFTLIGILRPHFYTEI